jgi:hypothetical protein
MPEDAVEVGVLVLKQLMKPVDAFHVGVAAHFAEDGGAFDGFVANAV